MEKQVTDLGRIHTADIVAISDDKSQVLAARVIGTMHVEIDVLDENGNKTGTATESREFEDSNISFGADHVSLSDDEIALLPTIETYLNSSPVIEEIVAD